MKTTTRNLLVSAAVAVLVLPALATLQGVNGYTATRLFAAAEVRTSTTYPTGWAGVRWTDLTEMELWAPIGAGQRDGIAAAPNGDLFVLVRGRDDNSGNVPEYTGLVRYDGGGFAQLTQDHMDSGLLLSRTGTEIQGVIVSRTSTGQLTAGHPVLFRERVERINGTRTYFGDVVSVDPVSAAETLISTFGSEASQARVAIDSSGGSTDGVLYVGPLDDGRIAALTWNGTGYDRTYVPGSFRAGLALAVSGDGDLYAFDSNESWSYAGSDTKDVYVIDPATGGASVYGSMPSWTHGFDWDVDATGSLWMGMRGGRNAKRQQRYVAEMHAGATIDSGDRISESDSDPWSITAGPSGEIFVLESPFDTTNGEVWKIEPGSGGGGSGGGGGKGGGKGKNK